MAQRPLPVFERHQRRTALMVGEGLAEELFLKHLRALYVVRGSKQITVKSAKGKGGAHVLDYTRRQSAQAAYDHVAALLDTDTDWGEEQQALAAKLSIEVFEAQPCLEAVLLRACGHRVPHSTPQCKKTFKQKFGAEAHAAGLFDRHFPLVLLEAARVRQSDLDRLIQFLLR